MKKEFKGVLDCDKGGLTEIDRLLNEIDIMLERIEEKTNEISGILDGVSDYIEEDLIS